MTSLTLWWLLTFSTAIPMGTYGACIKAAVAISESIDGKAYCISRFSGEVIVFNNGVREPAPR